MTPQASPPITRPTPDALGLLLELAADPLEAREITRAELELAGELEDAGLAVVERRPGTRYACLTLTGAELVLELHEEAQRA